MTKYSHPQLRAIARQQRQILWSILFFLLVAVGGRFGLTALSSQIDSVDVKLALTLGWSALMLSFGILQTVLMFRLAHNVSGIFGTVVLGIVWVLILGMILVGLTSMLAGPRLNVPHGASIFLLGQVLGPVILLIVNDGATKVLKRHGVHVGLMGADSRDLRSYALLGYELDGRAPTSATELFDDYFSRDEVASSDVPGRVRRIFAKHTHYREKRLLPDDDLTFFWCERDMKDLIGDLKKEFNVKFSSADAARLDCTIRAFSVFVDRKVANVAEKRDDPNETAIKR